MTGVFDRRYAAWVLVWCACLGSAARGLDWETKPSWKVEGQKWNAAGPGPLWDTLFSKTKCRDGSFRAVVRITKAADLNAAESWQTAATDELLPGYEASLVFRHAGNKFYRLCLSSYYKEVGLWCTDGGWLAVRDCPLAINTDHRVQVDFSGDGSRCSWTSKRCWT